MSEVDQRAFRNAMGNFCTGIVIATGIFQGKPAGFAAQSFVSVSLDPALVAFCPGKQSTSWPKLRESGHFCINILAADQLAMCDLMARSGGDNGADKFADVQWRPGLTGSPILHNTLGYVECQLDAEHEAGDHTIAVGRVLDFGVQREEVEPLTFFRGGYGGFTALASA